MMKAGIAPHRCQHLERARHRQHAFGAEQLDVLVADLEGLEEGRQQAQGVAGVVARPAHHVGEEVVVAAETGEELGPVGDEALGELLGVVVAGERAFAVGDVEPRRRRCGARSSLTSPPRLGEVERQAGGLGEHGAGDVFSCPSANWRSVW